MRTQENQRGSKRDRNLWARDPLGWGNLGDEVKTYGLRLDFWVQNARNRGITWTHSIPVRFPRRWVATLVPWVSTDTSKNLLPPSTWCSATNQLVHIFFMSLARLQVFKTVLPRLDFAMPTHSSIFLDMVYCPAVVQWRSRETLPPSSRSNSKKTPRLAFQTMKIEAAGSSETSVKMYTYFTVSHPRRHLHSQAIKNIKLHFRLQAKETTNVLNIGQTIQEARKCVFIRYPR
jgi:hypothetical protein